LFNAARKLVSLGARFAIEDTIGMTASVYQRIPPDGRGMIQVAIDGMTREIEALSEDKVELESFQAVKVVRVVDHMTVTVKKSDV